MLSFMLHEDPLGSLATRDVVARAIDRILKQGPGTHHVHLITDHLDAEAELEGRFHGECSMRDVRATTREGPSPSGTCGALCRRRS